MDPGRVVVLAGHPTAEELAAVTTALGRYRRSLAEGDRHPAQTSRWVRAARLEASGHPPIDRPTALTR